MDIGRHPSVQTARENGITDWSVASPRSDIVLGTTDERSRATLGHPPSSETAENWLAATSNVGVP